MYDNILDRVFVALKPAEKMVSDITYISTDEGWLFEGFEDFEVGSLQFETIDK